MRTSFLSCAALAALCAGTAPCGANVVISNAATQNMSCSAGTCAPTATEAVLNVQDLEAMLASGNATVTTTGVGVQATNINIKARLSWSAATTLALDAFRSIEVTSKVTVADSGGVSLTSNDGGSGGDFACGDGGALTFANTSSKLTINGTAYTLVDNVASLASAIAGHPRRTFALAKNYNAKNDGTYTTSPIMTTLEGTFDGLGNTIFNLSINDPTNVASVGLFAETAAGSRIANVRLVNESVQAGGSEDQVGGLVGSMTGGVIAYSFTSGSVSASSSAFSSASSLVGGLVGVGGSVAASGSTAAVSGEVAGGLLAAGGPISDSWATGNISGSALAGGLVGESVESGITHSWASGQVSSYTAGGLVGDVWGWVSIERSSATGSVTCQLYCGGLVGSTSDTFETTRISQSYATGKVTNTSAYDTAGGLVGDSSSCETCEITNSYASGAVSASVAGGLVGQNGVSYPHHTVVSSYASGTVNGTDRAGGLIGNDGYSRWSKVKLAYWDMTTSGITDPSQGAGNIANDHGIKGLSNKRLKSDLPKGLDPKIWREDSRINGGLPYLINNPPAN